MKPLGRKAYGSIGHLPGSRIGPGDHHVHEGQDTICQYKAGHRSVYVQEKLDGSCVAIARIDGAIVPLIRAGYVAQSSPREFHHDFHHWAMSESERFMSLLSDGERCVGEWLALAHGTRYGCPQGPFVAFDLMTNDKRRPTTEVADRCSTAGVAVVPTIHTGAIPVEEAMVLLGECGFHEAHPDDGPEGVVYRVETRDRVDFLAKWVRPDKVDGKYLADISGGEEVWNWSSSSTARSE